ncbi:MAG: hypothetical protein IPG74_13200 [Flavobacteriales bacterium]|nr:hypothetical protein [Flavobacteriales bacterium]
MKQLLTLLPATCLSILANAQCDVNVPSNATVIYADGTVTDGGNFWVCEGITATFTGFAPFVYAEEGCTITVTGLLGAFVVKANSTITLNGNNNNVVYDATTTLIDNGNNNISSVCPVVVLDYSNAPVGGCSTSMVVAANGKEVVTSIHPNPAHEQVNIAVLGDVLLGVQLIDMSGRVVIGDAGAQGRAWI